MEAANSARPLPHFNYIPTHGGNPSHQLERVDARCWDPLAAPRRGPRPNQQLLPRLKQPTPGGPPTMRNKNRPLGLGERSRKCAASAHRGAGTLFDGAHNGVWGKEAPQFACLHNDPLVVEMKIASAIVRRILVDAGSSVDIITWNCLKKLAAPWTRHRPLGAPYPGLRWSGMRFGDKTKSKNLEVDFLVVDVLTAYNVILRRLTLHRGHDPHRRPADARPRSGGKLRNSYPPGNHCPGSPGPCVGTRGCRYGLAGLLLSLGCINPGLRQRLLQLTLQPLLLGLTGIQISPQLLATPLPPPSPPSEDLSHGYLLLGYLRGIRCSGSYQVPGLYQVLDKRELGAGIHLDEVGRWPLGEWRGTAGNSGGGCNSVRRSGVLLNGGGTVSGRPAP
ncbi:LOW QUALITY PROTEIN: hypothetical protein Cgig2_019433 [Carnegiea gigantea]|uniref:Uncharacterized protein n=1 Tax=Carnegiea gigantea TaxID=171969 RepID=A0A9Q1KPR1_9CARY|nr:LOW QUALITY PROTEIN: hypothetical protein Cgig2_019433 [Carnegiea gigantea]